MISCVDAECVVAPSAAMVLSAKPSSSRVVSRVTDVSDFWYFFPFAGSMTVSKMKGKGEKVLA